MVEQITCFVGKGIRDEIREEMTAVGVAGVVSEAEFCGAALTAQIALMRTHRLTEAARAAAAKKAAEEPKVDALGQYRPTRTPVR